MRNVNQIYEKNFRLFTAFLKLNNAYERYFVNLHKSKKECVFTEAIISFPYYTIDRTLVWRDTNEGWDFWNEINQKCKDFFRKINHSKKPLGT